MVERRVVYGIGGLDVTPRDRRVMRDGQPVRLGGRAFDLLLALIEADGGLVGKDALLERAWPGLVVEESNLHTQVSALRKALAGHAVVASEPGRGYRLLGAVETRDATGAGSGAAASRADGPSGIAVLPFDNLSGDPEQGFFADGMAEELINALSRMRWLTVIARNSSFAFRERNADLAEIGASLGVRYVVGGSVRRAARRIRIVCHLSLAATGRQLWSDRFEGDLDDVFDLQDRVTCSVLGAIEPELRGAEVAIARAKPTADLAAYDHYLRAMGLMSPRGSATMARAAAELEAAIALDPAFAPALALAAYLSCLRAIQRWIPGEPSDFAAAAARARDALRLAPTQPQVVAYAAMCLTLCGESLEASLALAQRAVALNPGSAFAHHATGYVLMQMGDPESALAELHAALHLSPLDVAWNGSVMSAISQTHLVAGRHDEAVRWAERAVNEAPDISYTHRVLLASLAMAGRRDALAAAWSAMERAIPGLAARGLLVAAPITHAAGSRRLAEGLRLAIDLLGR
jgi:TolB-like protein/Tfp pilus assembly protein PilF